MIKDNFKMLTVSMSVIINNDWFQTGFLNTPPCQPLVRKKGSSSPNSRHLFSVTVLAWSGCLKKQCSVFILLQRDSVYTCHGKLTNKHFNCNYLNCLIKLTNVSTVM